MGNLATLQPNVFSKENQPENKGGRKKGILNRATVFKKFLSMKIEVSDPKDLAEKLKITLYEAAALAQLQAAAAGNTQAWKEIQDSIHGKQIDKTEVTGKDGKDLMPPKIIIEIVNGSNGSTDSTDQD